MATVTMIPAKSKVGARAKSEDAPKLRVVAYCRYVLSFIRAT